MLRLSDGPVSKQVAINKIKDSVNTYKSSYELKNLGKVLKAKKSNDTGVIKELLYKDKIQQKSYRDVLPPAGYPINSGSANVFFTRNTLLKPGKQVGESGVVMRTDDAVKQSMNMVSAPEFGKVNVDSFKGENKLVPMREFSGRPKNSEVSYKLDKGVFIVPKKEWASFSKNNPDVMKVREDRARKIMINQNKPMVFDNWSV